MSSSPAAQLRALLDAPGLQVMPCCFDALSARLIEQAGFELTFMSGFAVSASRLGMPDTGLISFGEMLDQGRNICSATRLPVIGDGDTGYGNALNVKRTVRSYASAGCAGVMIEDQIAAYPLTLLSAATAAMLEALNAMRNGDRPANRLDFDRLRGIVGFKDYDAEAERYRVEDD